MFIYVSLNYFLEVFLLQMKLKDKVLSHTSHLLLEFSVQISVLSTSMPATVITGMNLCWGFL